MRRIVLLSFILTVSVFASRAAVSDSTQVHKMYLTWNDDSSLRDSLQKKDIIPPYNESRYMDECVEDGQVKHLLSVGKLSHFKKGDEERFMFLFNDPHFAPGEVRTVAAISFQGDEVLPDLANEIKYITLNTKFAPLINAEFMPAFTGGYGAMMKYLNEKAILEVHDNTDALGLYGAVMLSFVVDRDGSIKDLKIIENSDDILDREAYRLVRSMPKWQAGKKAGKPVPVFVVLQLIFKR